jgi:DNA-binding MarR family transcriptional regulator
MTNQESENLSTTLWRTLYQTYTRFKNGIDRTLGEYGLTMEQYLVLVTIRFNDPPVRITDIASVLERSTNSISMLVDRMVKAGLLKRARDRKDRRVVNVSLTGKAEDALKPANPAFWEFMQQGMSTLSHEDKHTLAGLLKSLNYKLLDSLNPGADIERMIKTDDKQHAYRMKQWHKQEWLATPSAKRSSRKKGKG